MGQIVKPQDAWSQWRNYFDSKQTQLSVQAVCTRALPATKLLRIALSQFSRVPKLMDCTKESVMSSLLACARLGLEPDNVTGRAYLIPYGKDCQLIIGYRGLVELARRTKEVYQVAAHVVCEGDDFHYEFGTEPSIKHVPKGAEPTADTITHAYAGAKLSNGEWQFDVMTKAEIDGIRRRSKARNDGPWVTDYPAMAKKTVLRRLCKLLPSTPELQQAVTIDEAGELGLPQTLDIVDETPQAPEGKATAQLDDFTKPKSAESTK